MCIHSPPQAGGSKFKVLETTGWFINLPLTHRTLKWRFSSCRHLGLQDVRDIHVNLDSSTPCWNDKN